MEDRKHHITVDEKYVPELKKRKINIDVLKVSKKMDDSKQPHLVEFGAMPPANDLLKASFKLDKNDPKQIIKGSNGDAIEYHEIMDKPSHLKYAIGIRKIGSNSVTIVPTPFHLVQHQISSLKPDEVGQQGTYLEQKLALNTAFGTSRSRINNRLKNMMEKAVSTYDVEREQKEAKPVETIFNPEDYPDMPWFNSSTTEKDQVYPLSSLINPDENRYYKQCARDIREKLKRKDIVENTETLNLLKCTKVGTYFVGSLTSFDKVRLLSVVSLLEYYRTLNVLYTCARTLRNPTKLTQVSNEQAIDENALYGACEKFYEKDGDKDYYTYNFTKLSKTKIINTAVVILLHINKFTIPIPLAKNFGVDFQIGDDVVTKHMLRLGCVTETIMNEVLQKKERSYVLKVPLKVVSIEKKRAKKK
ncbi:Uncharacterized protein QTN25_001908 [Entamoeba marina]